MSHNAFQFILSWILICHNKGCPRNFDFKFFLLIYLIKKLMLKIFHKYDGLHMNNSLLIRNNFHHIAQRKFFLKKLFITFFSRDILAPFKGKTHINFRTQCVIMTQKKCPLGKREIVWRRGLIIRGLVFCIKSIGVRDVLIAGRRRIH